MAGKIKVTQIRSEIGVGKKQRDTLRGLGLRKLHQTRELEDTPAVRGMALKICHLVKLEEA